MEVQKTTRFCISSLENYPVTLVMSARCSFANALARQ